VATTPQSLIGRSYLFAVPAAGIAVITAATIELVAAAPPLGWALLTALTSLAGAYTIKVPGLVVRLSVSEPLVFLSTFLYGPAAGALTAAVDACVASLRLLPRLRTLHRILFNVGTVAISVYVAAQIYFVLAGLDMREPQYGALDTFVWPLYVFAAGVFVINSGLVALALGIERHTSAFEIWRSQFLWLAATYLASASIAAILVTFTSTFNWALVGLLLPLAAVSFVAVRTTLGRLDDANQHLAEVNAHYLSTIETLAMAIDAKDQVTHGHIRRVQRFAVELAKGLGVIDDRQLKAIEAAALLHDMGKLAIPEFILNKPGKLTASEFDVMKTHAALGADILSSIHFPYPVVPIVRHHHENWDGTGYPDGLRGSDIPIGARILSVVDCYDALTSDRPYRPALTDAQAIEILTQRRGRMYDPLVVDTFVEALQTLKASVKADLLPSPLRTLAHASAEPNPGAPTAKAAAGVPAPSAGRIEAVAGSLALLTSLAPYPAGRTSGSVARDILHRLRSVTSFDSGVVFTPDDDTLALHAIAVDGPFMNDLSRITIPVGERLTGWAAAHRTSVWNSDAALDLGPDLTRGQLVLASAVSLTVSTHLIGVLTLYGRSGQHITLADRVCLEAAAALIAAELADSQRFEPRCIDGRRAEVRSAIFPVIEAALSNDGTGKPLFSVVGLRFDAIRRDDGRRLYEFDYEAAVQQLLRVGLKQQRARYALVLSSGTVLLIADTSAAEPLQATLEGMTQKEPFQQLTLRTSRIRDAFELQMFARSAVEPPSSALSASHDGPSVH
jgi:putative nucleotidyltransferase with HDIG domain